MVGWRLYMACCKWMLAHSWLHMAELRCELMMFLGRLTKSETKHAGGWDKNEHATVSYMTDIPFPAVSVRAGHRKNTYTVPRARVAPPPELAQQLFPWADADLAELREVRG